MAKTVYLLLKNRLQALAFSMFKMSKGKKTSTTKTVLLTLLAVYLFFCIFLFMTFLFAAIAPPLICHCRCRFAAVLFNWKRFHGAVLSV